MTKRKMPVTTIIVSIGVLYFSLHSLPERMAHRTNQAQAGVIAVLCLIALFTHQHIFWIIAILLAFIRVPDFETPLTSISESLRRLAPDQGDGPVPAAGPVQSTVDAIPVAATGPAGPEPLSPVETDRREG
jgi:hypothetical protein